MREDAKPRFDYRGNVWRCLSVIRPGVWYAGYGNTVREAWEDWKKQQRIVA